MSGIVQNNILRSSGTVAVSAAGLNWSDTIITGSTATVEAGNGYWINTTSNTCTITLPSSAESGDQIVLIDYARTWGTNKIIIDSNGLNYQGNDDTYTVEYTTDGQSLNIVYSDATKGWLPLEDDVVALEPAAPPTQRAIFAFGRNASNAKVNVSNLVNSSGVVSSDVSGVGTERWGLRACGFGGDKAIFAFGTTGSHTNISNLVNNSGTVASDTTGVGQARISLSGVSYGGDKGIFTYGSTSVTNLVSNSGVVATDVTQVGTSGKLTGETSYGGDKALVYGGERGAAQVNFSNLISNVGVVGTDVSGVGTARTTPCGVPYGSSGQASFFYGGASGGYVTTRNLVSNVGVIASDSSGAGLARQETAGAKYGGDKAIIAFGITTTGSGKTNVSNLVTNTGGIGTDVTGVGTERNDLGAAGYSTSA
jgi:hypothetical protein